MNNLEKEVDYFINLILNNIQIAKTKKSKKAKEDAVFHNINVKSDGEEIAIWDTENDYGYVLHTKEIEHFDFKHYITKHLTLTYINKLTKYANNEITFEEFADIREKTNPVVKKLLEQKNYISEQLKLLRSNRNIPEVQEYIEKIYNGEYASEYVKYLIDKYYYNKKDLIKPEKNGLERMHKMLLR